MNRKDISTFVRHVCDEEINCSTKFYIAFKVAQIDILVNYFTLITTIPKAKGSMVVILIKISIDEKGHSEKIL